MTIVVGYLPDKGGRACLDLAALLARSGVRLGRIHLESESASPETERG